MRVEFCWCRRFEPTARTGRKSGRRVLGQYRVWVWGVDRGWIAARGAARRGGIEHGEYQVAQRFYWCRRLSRG